MTEPYNITARVNAAWARSGLTKAQVAKRAGIRWAQLQKILIGHRPHISADTVRRLAEALSVSSDYLLGLTEEPARLGRCPTCGAFPVVYSSRHCLHTERDDEDVESEAEPAAVA